MEIVIGIIAAIAFSGMLMNEINKNKANKYLANKYNEEKNKK